MEYENKDKIAVIPIKDFIEIMNDYVKFLEDTLPEGIYMKFQIIKMFKDHFFDIKLSLDSTLVKKENK